MRRREFIAGLALPLLAKGACAQQPLRKIGFLGANTPATAGHLTEAFVKRLNELGWVEGKNVAIVYRWAAGQDARYRDLSAELVAENVEVIVTSGTFPTLAARQATQSIPIVMASSASVLGVGLVDGLARPGGNVTGLTFAPEDTVAKRLELLSTLVPELRRVGVLYNPDANLEELRTIRSVAPALSLELAELAFRQPAELEEIGATCRRTSVGGLLVISDPLVFVNLCTRHRGAVPRHAEGARASHPRRKARRVVGCTEARRGRERRRAKGTVTIDMGGTRPRRCGPCALSGSTRAS